MTYSCVIACVQTKQHDVAKCVLTLCFAMFVVPTKDTNRSGACTANNCTKPFLWHLCNLQTFNHKYVNFTHYTRFCQLRKQAVSIDRQGVSVQLSLVVSLIFLFFAQFSNNMKQAGQHIVHRK